MQILTWNINGIRATKEPLKLILDRLGADIICLQETKVTRDQLDEVSTIVEGYNSYFSFSKGRSGYSGVATFVKDNATPVKAEEGLTGTLQSPDNDGCIGHYGNQSNFSDEELQALDREGRTVITQHKYLNENGEEELVAVINVYCPRADPENEERKSFKLRFYDLLQLRAEAILGEKSHVIVLGDINTAHNTIDHCDPDEKEFFKNPGRKWLTQFLCDVRDGHGSEIQGLLKKASGGQKFVDTFRYFHPDQEKAFTCWCTMTGARATNYGARIDYIFADVALNSTSCADCVIMPEVEGSDHCPVKATFNFNISPNGKPPPLCSKYLPEFSGKQQKLSAFFCKKSDSTATLSSQSSISSQSSGDSLILSESVTSGRCSTSTNILKRKLSDTPGKVLGKYARVRDNKTMQKQGSLLSFLKRPKPESTAHETREQQDSAEAKTVCENEEKKVVKDTNPENIPFTSSPSELSEQKEKKSKAASSWKSLLKGPPAALLCKGHKEPCLLRTVKKDSLNKGRQFWVCNRPEGHKTNPEARCDTFEWVEKKKR